MYDGNRGALAAVMSGAGRRFSGFSGMRRRPRPAGIQSGDFSGQGILTKPYSVGGSIYGE